MEELVRQATEFYDHELRAVMEAEPRDEFIAVEPISRTYDLGQSMNASVEIMFGRLPY